MTERPNETEFEDFGSIETSREESGSKRLGDATTRMALYSSNLQNLDKSAKKVVNTRKTHLAGSDEEDDGRL